SSASPSSSSATVRIFAKASPPSCPSANHNSKVNRRLSMDFERVKVEVHGHVGVLKLNHPEVMNAVSPEMLKGLMGAMAYIEKPATGLRALVLTGEGRGFCAGANLSGG